MRSLYIYYRVQSSQRQALWSAVSEMQLALRGLMPGLAASLSEKLDGASRQNHEPAVPPAPLLTWMEIYQFNGHASDEAWQRFEQTLADHSAALPCGIEGPRHLERFMRLSAPCLTPADAALPVPHPGYTPQPKKD